MTAINLAAPSSPWWRRAWAGLWAVFLLTAALNMARVRGGFLTSHAADLATPALLYIVLRRYPPAGRHGGPLSLRALFGRTPEVAALVVFLGATATELSQRFWPHGLFPGTYDPLDIAAYAVSVLVPYVADRLETGRDAIIAS